MNVRIMDVKRLAIHDGPGIRTTLFLKGCPLHCLWCHNPEGISGKPQIAAYRQKCINCGECARVCPAGVHFMTVDGHEWRDENCIACGRCEENCLGAALKVYGRSIGIEEACELLLQDRAFYAKGGITLSGGEPLLQPHACRAILENMRRQGVHTAVDTCGAVERSALEEVLPYVDLFLFDIKHMDSEMHRKLTGLGNELILENLRWLSDAGAEIEIRIPVIPGMNDDAANIESTGRFLSKLRIRRVVLLPYHSLAGSKYEALKMANLMPEAQPPARDEMQRLADILQGYGLRVDSPSLRQD